MSQHGYKYRQKYHNFEEEEKKDLEKEEEYVVISFGKNDKLQTGHDYHATNDNFITNKNIYKPQIVKFLFDKITNPIYICCGFDDSGIIDDSGNVILWGDNTNNQISNYKNLPYLGPHCLSLSNKIKQIALTANSSLFLDKLGRVWSVGGANNGDLLSMKFPFSNNNNKYNEYINYICCGYQHCGAISNYHKLYVWGNNKYSQLGFSSKNNYISYPKCIQLQNGINKCVMGRWHTLVLTNNGYIFSSGWGRFGVLGLNDTYNRNRFEQITVKQNTNVCLYGSDIKCGAVHSCCVVEDNKNNKNVYVWGRGKYGRLGLGNEENVLQPTLLKIRFEKYMDTVDKIELGGDHGIIISKYGSIYVWGKTLEGQLGLKTNSNILQPRKLVLNKDIVNNYQPSNCTLGDCHSMILMKKRNITSQARGYYNRKQQV